MRAPDPPAAARSGEFLAAIARWIPAGADVAIVDVPVHRNVGDLFILAATHRLLADLGCRVVYAAGVRDYRTAAARRAINAHTILLGLGGGNFGDLYPKYQALRERVVADFPGHRMVVLPQTLHFRDSRALARGVDRLGGGGDLRIATRDRASFDLARRITPQVMLLPDIVDALGALIVDANRDVVLDVDVRHLLSPAGTLFLLRRDDERASGRSVAGRDWADVFPGFLRRLAMTAALMPVVPASASTRLHEGWASHAATMLVRAVRVMQQAERVVTDRLHGAVVARLAGRPVTLIDNSYGKLLAYRDAWWLDDPSIASE